MSITCCRLCPRRCGVNRAAGETGFCGAPDEIRIGRFGLHQWEEPCISGENGSGTVFFSHCTLKCVYCQNYAISTENRGRVISIAELAGIFLQLQEMGAHNINLVTPTHYVPQIMRALDCARKDGLSLPIVYNTSGYERVETLRALRGYVDIYMPDFKYWRQRFAQEYSAAPDYTGVISSVLAEMAAQTLPVQFSDGIMMRGMIVRHMLLPGLLYDAKKIIDYLYKTYGDKIYISIMSQYTPLPHVAAIPELNRRVGGREYAALCDYAARIGLVNAFIQEGSAASESFIPDFYTDKE